MMVERIGRLAQAVQIAAAPVASRPPRHRDDGLPDSEPGAQPLRRCFLPDRRPLSAQADSFPTLVSDELTGHQAAGRHGRGRLSEPPLRHYRVLVIAEHCLQTTDSVSEPRGALAHNRTQRFGRVPAPLGLDPDLVQGGVRQVVSEGVHGGGQSPPGSANRLDDDGIG
jgi:hypothetical protein